MKITLKWKVIAACIVLEILALAIIAGINFQMINGYLDQIAIERLEQLKSCLSNQFDRHAAEVKSGEIIALVSKCQADDGAVYFVLFDHRDHIAVKKNWPGSPLPEDANILAAVEAVGKFNLPTPSFYNVIYINTPEFSHLLYGGTSLYKPHAQHDLLNKALILSLVSILVSIVLGTLLMSWVSRHLKKLEKAANQILRGNYDVSIDYVGNDEIGRVGFAINLVTTTLKNEIQLLRKSEESERQTAERMLKVIDAVPDFMLLSRVSDAFIIYANAGVENMTGYAYNELIGKTVDEVELGITKDQRNDWKRHLVKNGSMTNYETVIRHKEGSLINVLVSASLLEIDNAEHVLIICRDITDRKLVEAAVAHANRQLNYVLDAASEIAIISTDVKGIVQMFNRGAEKMLGYRAREQIGIAMPFEIHDANELMQRSQELSAHFGREVKTTEVLTIIPAKMGSETRNWTYICKNGQRLSVSLTVTRVQDSAGRIVGFLGIARDITLQLQAEKALQELNYQLEKRVEERTAELEDTNNNLANTMHNLQLAQAELVRSEKLTALGDIVAVVAHEINTPIGNCLTVATTLRDRSEELFGEVEQGTIRRSSLSRYMNDSKTGMDILIRGLHRSSELISNFKQVAVDQTSEQRRIFKLDKVVNEVVALMLPMLRKTPYKLTILIPEEINMDSFPGPIEQIVTNLINNSILHAFDEDQPGQMTLTAERQEHQVKIEFADDGRGIPEHYLNRIFDPFFTTKLGRGGTGLGLNIVHNIVKKMLGGQIEVSSTAGSGTSFSIVLPLVAPTNPVDRR
jgi:PAS domain S-box-containing protein